LPTLAEATGSDWNALAWGGVAGPAGLPADVIAMLQATLARMARSEEFIELIERRGTGAIYRDADGFREYMAGSDASFGRAMSAVGLVP
ncbi:MAG: tripartite tricarboxylate transporter substrate-binding protein, partial [Vicinamibacterales bacterium]|nr:tripartite tricarboxylate transporter substrate-binding protein [Vicinamibacterales bacterium]